MMKQRALKKVGANTLNAAAPPSNSTAAAAPPSNSTAAASAAAAASSSTTAPLPPTDAIHNAISTNEKKAVTVQKIGSAETTLIESLHPQYKDAIIYAVLPLRIATTSEGGRRTRRGKKAKRSTRRR